MLTFDLDPQYEIIIQVGIAMLLGGLIGIERELADKPAGFRTHMLVAGAAALLVGLTDVLAHRFTAEQYGDLLRIDPIRIVEAIITGISFLGAGTIFRGQGKMVQGLTTAASILLASGIGIAVALGQYVLSLGVVVLTLIVLRIMQYIERRLGHPSSHHHDQDKHPSKLRNGDPLRSKPLAIQAPQPATRNHYQDNGKPSA